MTHPSQSAGSAQGLSEEEQEAVNWLRSLLPILVQTCHGDEMRRRLLAIIDRLRAERADGLEPIYSKEWRTIVFVTPKQKAALRAERVTQEVVNEIAGYARWQEISDGAQIMQIDRKILGELYAAARALRAGKE